MKPIKMSAARRLEELQSFVNLCFAMLEKHSIDGVAELTGLSTTTIRRLHSNEFTLAVRFGMVQALGLAAGLRLEMTSNKAKVKLAA